MKQNKGITLIALIITIIVLLILAIVTIRAVQGDGIISKAQLAKNNYTDAQNDEDGKIADYESYLNGTNGTSGTTTEIKVGDRVKYETVLSAVDSTKLTQLKSDLSTYSGDSSSTDNSSIDRDSLTWKVLDIKDGKIRLISSAPTTKLIKLYSYNGYNNAVYLLNEACDVLYSSNKGKAQNLKIEDIEEKLSASGKSIRDNWSEDGIKYGGTKEYTSSDLKYPNIYPSEVGCKGKDGTSGSDNNIGTLGLSEQTSLIDGKSSPSRLKMTQTCWKSAMNSTNFSNSNYYTFFINNGSNYSKYWLSSRCFFCGSSMGAYAVSSIIDGGIEYTMLMRSDGMPAGKSYAFRPVVTLEPNVQLVSSGTGTWEIQQ